MVSCLGWQVTYRPLLLLLESFHKPAPRKRPYKQLLSVHSHDTKSCEKSKDRQSGIYIQESLKEYWKLKRKNWSQLHEKWTS